jgi:hypothetical protein
MVSDIRLKTTFLRHPKTRALRRSLGAESVLSLLQLWCWAAEFRPTGDLSGLSDDEIAFAADWASGASEFVSELRAKRWLDGTKLHGWREHQPWAFFSESRSKLARKAAKTRWLTRHAKRSPKRNTKRKAPAKPPADADGNAPSPTPAPSPNPTPKHKDQEQKRGKKLPPYVQLSKTKRVTWSQVQKLIGQCGGDKELAWKVLYRSKDKDNPYGYAQSLVAKKAWATVNEVSSLTIDEWLANEVLKEAA